MANLIKQGLVSLYPVDICTPRLPGRAGPRTLGPPRCPSSPERGPGSPRGLFQMVQSDVKSLVIKFTFFKIASSISRTTVARTKIVSMFDNSLGQENMILLILFFFCLE